MQYPLKLKLKDLIIQKKLFCKYVHNAFSHKQWFSHQQDISNKSKTKQNKTKIKEQKTKQIKKQKQKQNKTKTKNKKKPEYNKTKANKTTATTTTTKTVNNSFVVQHNMELDLLITYRLRIGHQ